MRAGPGGIMVATGRRFKPAAATAAVAGSAAQTVAVRSTTKRLFSVSWIVTSIR